MVTDEKGARLDYSAGSEPNTIVSLHQHTSAKVERVWIRTSDRSSFRGIHSTYGDDIPVLKHDNKQTRYYSQRVNLIRLMFKVEFKLNALRSWLQMTNNSTWKTRQLNCFFVHYLRLTAIHTDEAILIMSECKRMNFFIFNFWLWMFSTDKAREKQCKLCVHKSVFNLSVSVIWRSENIFRYLFNNFTHVWLHNLCLKLKDHSKALSDIESFDRPY